MHTTEANAYSFKSALIHGKSPPAAYIVSPMLSQHDERKHHFPGNGQSDRYVPKEMVSKPMELQKINL